MACRYALAGEEDRLIVVYVGFCTISSSPKPVNIEYISHHLPPFSGIIVYFFNPLLS